MHREIPFVERLSTWLLRWSLSNLTTTCWMCGHLEFCFSSYVMAEHHSQAIKLRYIRKSLRENWNLAKDYRMTIKTLSTCFSSKIQICVCPWSESSFTRGWWNSKRSTTSLAATLNPTIQKITQTSNLTTTTVTVTNQNVWVTTLITTASQICQEGSQTSNSIKTKNSRQQSTPRKLSSPMMALKSQQHTLRAMQCSHLKVGKQKTLWKT